MIYLGDIYLSKIESLSKRLLNIEQATSDLNSGYSHFKKENSNIKQEISSIKQEVANFRSDTFNLKQESSGLKQELSNLKQETSSHKQESNNLKREISSIKQEISIFNPDFINSICKKHTHSLELSISEDLEYLKSTLSSLSLQVSSIDLSKYLTAQSFKSQLESSLSAFPLKDLVPLRQDFSCLKESVSLLNSSLSQIPSSLSSLQLSLSKEFASKLNALRSESLESQHKASQKISEIHEEV